MRHYWAAGSCECFVYSIVSAPGGKWGLYQSDRGRSANALPSGLTFEDAKMMAAEWDRDYHNEHYGEKASQ